MKKEFKIPVSYTMYGTISIEANNVEEAMKIAINNIDELELPDDSEYVDGSYEIGDIEITKLIN